MKERGPQSYQDQKVQEESRNGGLQSRDWHQGPMMGGEGGDQRWYLWRKSLPGRSLDEVEVFNVSRHYQ